MKIVFKRTNFGAALLGSLLCTVILFLVTLYHDGGQLHGESALFFINYLDGRPLLKQIFDPLHNDWGCYQARELSYFFDALDARFIAFLLKNRIIWFHSFCSLLFCGAMIFIQQYFSRRFFPRIPGMLITLVSLFFVLAAPVSGLDYFRCAKYLTALGLWGAFFSGYGAFRWKSPKGKVCFILSLLLMTLSDRQGFFFTAAICGTSALLLFCLSWMKTEVLARRMRFLLFSSFGVVCFGILNNLYITPQIIRHLNNYTPDFSYQRDISVAPLHLKEGFLFLTGNIGSWFNNFTGDYRTATLTGILLTGGIVLELYRRYRRSERSGILLAVSWGTLLLAMLVCSVIMVARLSIIMEADFFYGIYTVTFMVVVLWLLTLTAEGGGKKFCRILLIFFTVALLLRLGGELATDKFLPEINIKNGWKTRQHILKESLRDPGFDETKHCLPHRMELFLEFYRKKVLTKQ